MYPYDDDFIDDGDYMDDEESPRRYTLDDALQAMPLTGEGLVPDEVVMGLSDLEFSDLTRVRPAWQKLDNEQRLIIMERLAEVGEVDYEVDYSAMARLGYEDTSPAVRVAAINAGYTDDSISNLNALLPIATKDASPEVRAAALSRLGQFIYLGEVEEIDPVDTLAARDIAYKLYNDPNEPLEVQRRALEAISHCSLNDVQQMIQNAYNHDDSRMRISAVNAMGNSCDPQWEKYILQEMNSDLNEMRFEAIKAAGSLSLRQAVERLGESGYDEDRQIQEASIWALGEIGGEEAISTLHALQNYAERNHDDDLLEAIEEAIDMAYFMSEDDLDLELMDIEDEYYDDEE